MADIRDEIRDFLTSRGVSDVGFACTPDSDTGDLKYAVSIVVRLSDGIIDEIDDAPTATYFTHYRAVNAFIDRSLLELGLFLQSKGYRYITVAASQSMPSTHYNGRYSHKEAACRANLGTVGRNCLFLHSKFGARVRLGTLFTDCPLSPDREIPESLCIGCDRCKNACPSGAILGVDYKIGMAREDIFSPSVCSEYMKKAYQHIGRGAVCGICMSVCPAANGADGR